MYTNAISTQELMMLKNILNNINFNGLILRNMLINKINK